MKASLQARTEKGISARQRAPRSQQGEWCPPEHRRDPVDTLQADSADRIESLVPLRYGRMLESPFAFFRGSAAVMAGDLACTPDSGLQVQLSGDAHLSNFGLFATAERSLRFGLNDFDETLPGPFEWDLKRLAASIDVVARQRQFSLRERREATLAAGLSYQQRMAQFASMREVAVWYFGLRSSDILRGARKANLRSDLARQVIREARKSDHFSALRKFTVIDHGKRRLKAEPPLLVPAESAVLAYARESFDNLPDSLSRERGMLRQRYHVVDVALKVVGVGSVGTRCWVVLLEGRDGNDPFFLQLKEAGESALEAYLGPSGFANHGERVVSGQRLIQSAGDSFLGWMVGPDLRHYYWRQFWDMKGEFEPTKFSPRGLRAYAGMCAWELARAHARTGDAVAISAYIGASPRFANAIADFADAYSQQTFEDYATMHEAEATGRIPVLRDVPKEQPRHTLIR